MFVYKNAIRSLPIQTHVVTSTHTKANAQYAMCERINIKHSTFVASLNILYCCIFLEQCSLDFRLRMIKVKIFLYPLHASYQDRLFFLVQYM